MVPLATGGPTLVQGRQSAVSNTRNPTTIWSPYFSTLLKAPAEENVIASVFYPSELKTPAGGRAIQFKLESDGATPVVSYTLNGRTVSYAFGAENTARRPDR